MSILTPIEITHEEKLKRHLSELSTISSKTVDIIVERLEKILKGFWEHPDFTPQECFDFYGNEAYKLFQESNDTIAFIQKYRPGYFPAVNITAFTINQDGTVTIG